MVVHIKSYFSTLYNLPELHKYEEKQKILQIFAPQIPVQFFNSVEKSGTTAVA